MKNKYEKLYVGNEKWKKKMYQKYDSLAQISTETSMDVASFSESLLSIPQIENRSNILQVIGMQKVTF